MVTIPRIFSTELALSQTDLHERSTRSDCSKCSQLNSEGRAPEEKGFRQEALFSFGITSRNL